MPVTRPVLHLAAAIAGLALVAGSAGCSPGDSTPTGSPSSATKSRSVPPPPATATSRGTTADAASSAPSSAAQFTPPAWFDEVRSEQRRIDRETFECAERQGADVTWNPQYGLAVNAREGNVVDSKTRAIVRKCSKAAAGPTATKDMDYWRNAYDRLLDIKKCYESKGYRVAEPPPRDRWAKALVDGKAMIWNPYFSLGDHELNGQRSFPAHDGLEHYCPFNSLLAEWNR